MKHVIIINGYGTCGKDKFVKMFARAIPLDKEMENVSTVDDVKEISKFMGWDGHSKTESDRQLWVDLKAAQTKYNNGIFKKIVEHIDKSDNDFFFVHCREPEEIQKFVNHYNILATKISEPNPPQCVTLLITRDGVKPPNNNSDRSVMDYTYNKIITNDGTLNDLMNKADCFYREITE